MSDRLLLINARILGDSRDAVLVEKGKIARIGYSPDMEATIPTSVGIHSVIDLQGRWLLPGFIDCHVHLAGTGLAATEIDLSTASCISDILSIIHDNIKNKQIVMARNLAPHRLEEKRYPTPVELDRISPSIPIIIRREDFHSAVCNTKAFEILGIKPVEVLRGREFECAQERLMKLVNPEEYEEAYVKVSEIALRNGVTTISGIFSDLREYKVWLQIKDKLPLTVIPFIEARTPQEVKELGLSRVMWDGRLLVDGSISSTTAALFEDYVDEPGNKGILYFSDEELHQFIVGACRDTPLQIAMHAIGDRAIAQLVNAYSKVPPNRHRIEHCELITVGVNGRSPLQTMKEKDIIISAQPSFESHFGKVYEEKLGKERALQMNPFRKIIDLGIHLAFGSDSPVTPIDPLKGIDSALSHPNPESRITLEEAVHCFTYEGAYANFLEHKIGSIKEGFDADLVCVSPDFSSVNSVIKKGKLCWKSF